MSEAVNAAASSRFFPVPTSYTAFWICCRFPALPLEALKASTMEDQPLVLVSASGSARTVLAANESAQSHGVRPGMPLNTAYSYCPHLQCSVRQPEAEQQRLRQLADIAYGFTPDVSLQPPDALLLECAGTLHLFNGPAGLLSRLAETWRELEHQSDFGIAHTPLAATVLAHAPIKHGSPAHAPGAHSASAIPLHTQVRQTLEHIKLKQLAGALWEPKVIERFAASGIHTLGAVFALPSAAVGRRFGRKLLADLERLSGTQADPRQYIRPSPHFCGSLNLLDPIRHRAGLAFPMHRLLRDLKAWLHARQLLTSGIEWRFSSAMRQSAHSAANDVPRATRREATSAPEAGSRHRADANQKPGTHQQPDTHEKPGISANTLSREGKAQDVCLEIRLAQPGMDDKRLLSLTTLQLERSALPAEIVTVELRSLNLLSVASQAENRQLFQNQHAHHSPETLLELLQARFGAQALHGLTLGDDHRPEYGWQPLPAPRFNALASLPKPHTNQLPLPRPTWLLAPPQPLARQAFELMRGPERIEAAWWDVHPSTSGAQSAASQSVNKQSVSKQSESKRPEKNARANELASNSTDEPGSPTTLAAQTALSATAARDYYLARNSRGELCWIFHQHGSDNWFLHGYFA